MSLLFGKHGCPLRASLERDYFVYLRHLSSSSHSSEEPQAHLHTAGNHIRVQGRQEDVSAAVAKIQRMIEMVEQGHSLLATSHHPPQTESSKTETVSTLPSKPVPVSCSGVNFINDDSENTNLLEVLGNLSPKERQDLIRSYRGKSSRNIIFPPQNFLDLSFQKRIDYFVQLEFPHDKVQSILESLGPTASDNEVMNLLMKGAPAVLPVNKSSGAYRNHVDGTRDYSESFGVTVMKSEPHLQQQAAQQKEMAVDASNLRHIVIDGSNVAMR